MPINDDPFQEEDRKKAEKKDDALESFDAEPSLDKDDEEIELVDILDASDDEAILELEEALDTVSEDRSALDLDDAQTAEPDEDDDVIELAMEPEPDTEQDEEILDLTAEMPEAPADEDDDVIELAMEPEPDTEQDEEILDLTAETPEVSVEDSDDDDLTIDTPVEPEEDDDIVDLTEHAETPATEIEEIVTTESTGQVSATDEDKEIMELIDDIQATLDDTEPPKADVEPSEADMDQTSSTENGEDSLAATEQDTPEPLILGDEESLETEELSDSESEFVDHLGLDLTSEFSKEIFGEDSKEDSGSLDMAQMEEFIVQTVHKMLSDKNSPLLQAIILAVKKEIENKIV